MVSYYISKMIHLKAEDRKVELDTTFSGCYCLPLKQREVEVEEVCVSMEDKSFEEKFKIVTKLYRQSAHPYAKNLKGLLKGNLRSKKSLVQMKECEKCKKTSHRRPQCAKWFSRCSISKSGI